MRILRLPAVLAKVSISRATVYNYGRLGLFPRPVKLGPRAVGWYESDIDAWIASRVLQI